MMRKFVDDEQVGACPARQLLALTETLQLAWRFVALLIPHTWPKPDKSHAMTIILASPVSSQ